MIIRFAEATRRKTPCHWLTVFGVEILFSYQTPVAFDDNYGVLYRQHNHWGPTTDRHMRETNVYDWPIIDNQEEFERALDRAIHQRIARDENIVAAIVAHKMAPEEAAA